MGKAFRALDADRQRFVLEVISDPRMNYVNAYQRTFNCTQSTARTYANRFGHEKLIQKAIQEEIKERNKRIRVDSDRLISELEGLAFTDIADYASWENHKLTIRDSNDISPEARRAITKVKQTRYGIEIEFVGKEKMIESLGRHLGVFEVDNKQIKETVTMNLADFYANGSNAKPGS